MSSDILYRMAIEMVWTWMKDWIQERYSKDHQLSCDALREVVRAVREVVPESFLSSLIKSMQARCQAVIEAEGGHTFKILELSIF